MLLPPAIAVDVALKEVERTAGGPYEASASGSVCRGPRQLAPVSWGTGAGVFSLSTTIHRPNCSSSTLGRHDGLAVDQLVHTRYYVQVPFDRKYYWKQGGSCLALFGAVRRGVADCRRILLRCSGLRLILPGCRPSLAPKSAPITPPSVVWRAAHLRSLHSY
jgi:hypothetical protein